MSRMIKVAFASSILSLFTMSAALACPGHERQAKAEQQQAAPAAHVATASFHVTGMHCAGCADEIRASLAKASGIVHVDVKLADKRVVVSYDKDKITAEKIAKLITAAGFQANAEV